MKSVAGLCRAGTRASGRLLSRLALAGVLVTAGGGQTSLWAQSAPAVSLEGSWDITITTTPSPPFASPFRILRTVGPTGVVDAYAFPSITPTIGALVNSSGHGAWKKDVATGKYKVFVRYFQLDPSSFYSTLDTIGSVIESVTLAADGNSYTSTFETQINHPDGKLIIVNQGQTSARRITVPGGGPE